MFCTSLPVLVPGDEAQGQHEVGPVGATGDLQLAQTFPPDIGAFKSRSRNQEVASQSQTSHHSSSSGMEPNLLHGETAHVHTLASLQLLVAR